MPKFPPFTRNLRSKIFCICVFILWYKHMRLLYCHKYRGWKPRLRLSCTLLLLLNDRKKATRQKKGAAKSQPRFPAPVLVAIEEAHVFIPKDEDTDTKYFASKVAREGRKFGLGLVIVSQRPRGIDANILSQMGSLAVMRMIQQDDQMHVSAASEALSRDLIDQLTSLDPGEAIFAGQWVNLPTVVKVEEVKERKIGGDQKAVEQWSQLAELKQQVAKESSESYIPSGYIQD